MIHIDEERLDIKGKKVAVVVCQGGIEDSPILMVLPVAWCEYTKISNLDLYMPFSGDDNGIALVCEGRCIGFMTWTDKRGNNAWVTMGWVDKEFRGQRLYEVMWNRFLEYAREAGYHAVFGSTGVNNTNMQKVMERTNRVPVGILYKYDMVADSKQLEDVGLNLMERQLFDGETK